MVLKRISSAVKTTYVKAAPIVGGTADKIGGAGRGLANGVAGGVGWIAGTQAAKSAFKKSTLFLILAFIINFIVERLLPFTAFSGFELTYFSNTILSGNWLGIYNLFHFNIFFMITIIAIFNLKNGRPHMIKVWLSIIFIMYLISAYPLLGSYLGARNVVELLLLLFTAIYLSFFENSREDFFATIIVLWVFYNLLMFGVTSIPGAMIHFIFFIMFFIVFCMGKAYASDRIQIKWWLLIIIFFDFIMPEILERAFPTLPVASLPFLFFGVLLFAQMYEPSWITTSLIIILVTFYFLQFSGVTMESVRASIDPRSTDPDQVDNRINIFSVKYWNNMFAGWINSSVYHASGADYYTSQVDANSKKDLGVYLTDLDDNPKRYYDNEKIILDAVLTAKNFVTNEDDPYFEAIDITLTCGAYKKNVLYSSGRVLPSNTFKIESFDYENIQCVFEPWQLEKGIYEMRFNAQFNFKTESYLKKYFVSKERINSLRRTGEIRMDEDILRLNKIEDTKPIAQNSVGPVEIRANSKVPSVIKLDSDVPNKYLFGVELYNAWDGRIERITSLEFYMPIPIKTDECDYHMELDSIPDTENYEGYTLTTLTDTSSSVFRNIKQSVKQQCWITIEPNSINEILAPGDITTRYFRMIARYDYNLEKKLSVSIIEPEGFNLKITGSESSNILDSSEPVNCIAKGTEVKNQDVTFTLFEEGIEVDSATKLCREDICTHDFNQQFPKNTNIKCTAEFTKDDDPYPKSTTSYFKIRNSPPIIEGGSFSPNEVAKGENLKCEVRAHDSDDEKVFVRFDFQGINVASTEKECSGICSTEIPTDSAQETTQVKCIVTPYDEENVKGETKEYIAKINVEAAST